MQPALRTHLPLRYCEREERAAVSKEGTELKHNDETDASPIYLDYQATTPLDPRVLEAMLPFFRGSFGNPHSTSHRHGETASKAVELARVEIAALLGAMPNEIIFTSGATESNNMLLRGAAAAGRRLGRDGVVTLSTEHRAVLDVVQSLAQNGHPVIAIDVASSGLVDETRFADAIGEATAVASAMMANNEIGVLQPVSVLADIAHEAGALFHTDAAQAVGKVQIDVKSMDIDLMSLSAHKLYGPMGIGAAFVSQKARRRIQPFVLGGGQQGGLRSGTLPVALCVGFGEACRISRAEMEMEAQRVTRLRDILLQRLRELATGVEVNGALEPRLPGNLNVSFDGVDAEALLMRVRDRISIASGSACTTESLEPSHVILALRVGLARAEGAIRVSAGRFTTEREIVTAAEIIANAVARLRGVSYIRREG